QKINLSNENYKTTADIHHRHQEFSKGDMVMARMRSERFPTGTLRKLHAKRMVPYHIRQRLIADAYVLELLNDVTISPIFNVEDLTPYQEPSDMPFDPFASFPPSF
ncbi:hypothetical protein CFOL_v3_00087, partial [Cephalotus follicularis]